MFYQNFLSVKYFTQIYLGWFGWLKIFYFWLNILPQNKHWKIRKYFLANILNWNKRSVKSISNLLHGFGQAQCAQESILTAEKTLAYPANDYTLQSPYRAGPHKLCDYYYTCLTATARANQYGQLLSQFKKHPYNFTPNDQKIIQQK